MIFRTLLFIDLCASHPIFGSQNPFPISIFSKYSLEFICHNFSLNFLKLVTSIDSKIKKISKKRNKTIILYFYSKVKQK